MTGKSFKERHISIDSARDSGIGDNSNFTDLEQDSKETTFSLNITAHETASCSFKKSADECDMRKKTTDTEQKQNMRGFWQPKVKRSLADRLPPNSFHLMPPSRYVFPGAEVYYDPDEKSSSDDCGSDTMSECC